MTFGVYKLHLCHCGANGGERLQMWGFLASAEAEELSKHMKAVIVICFLFAEHHFGGVSAKQQMPLSNYLETAAAPSLSQL